MTKVEFSDVVISKDWSKVKVVCPRYTKDCDWGRHIRIRMGVASMRECYNPASVTVWGAGVYWPTDRIFVDAQDICKRCASNYNRICSRINQRVRG